MTKKKLDKQAEIYMTLCNLFEAIWLKRRSKTYYEINTNNLPPMTSPQARKLATFVFDLFLDAPADLFED
jgi:hypothetical protein